MLFCLKHNIPIRFMIQSMFVKSNLRAKSSHKQNGHHGAVSIFKCIFLNENCCISTPIRNTLDSIDSLSVLIQVIAWHQSGVKPLPDPMLTHIYDTIRHSATMS